MESLESRREAARVTAANAADGERSRQRQSLLLSRTRILNDLDRAVNPPYREILQAALKHVDDKLADLN